MSKVVKIGTLGLVDDAFGEQAAADAAREAAGLQAEAGGRGLAETTRQFDITQATLAPSIEAGNLARDQQQAMLGLLGTDAQTQAMTALQESPSQAFIRKRAQRNLLQNSAAIGGLGGGNVRSALVEQGAGFASADIDQQFRRLQGLSSPGTQTAVQSGQLSGQFAGQQAGMQAGIGQAQASGVLGAAQAQAQGTQQLLGLGALGLGAMTGGASLPFTSAAGVGGTSSFLAPQSSNVNIGFV